MIFYFFHTGRTQERRTTVRWVVAMSRKTEPVKNVKRISIQDDLLQRQLYLFILSQSSTQASSQKTTCFFSQEVSSGNEVLETMGYTMRL
jgi:hypothetical protein